MLLEFLTMTEYTKLQLALNHKQQIVEEVVLKEKLIDNIVRTYVPEPMNIAPANKVLRRMKQDNYENRLRYLKIIVDDIIYVPSRINFSHKLMLEDWKKSIFNPEHDRSVSKQLDWGQWYLLPEMHFKKGVKND